MKHSKSYTVFFNVKVGLIALPISFPLVMPKNTGDALNFFKSVA